MERGSLKHDIVYVGRAANTACRSTCFPALDRYLVDQLIDFCLILSMRFAKISHFFLSKCSGSPKYLPTPPLVMDVEEVLYPGFNLTWYFCREGYSRFAKVCTLPWRLLIHLVKTRFNALQQATLVLVKNMVSPANNRWFTGWASSCNLDASQTSILHCFGAQPR